MTRIAGALLAFERPHYLRQTLNSLEECIEKENIDWYLFQDGIKNKFSGRKAANKMDVNISFNILRQSDLPNKKIVKNEYNLSIPLQVDKVFSLFDEGYDLVMFFENDVIVSKYSLRLNRLIMEQYPDCIPTLYTNRSVDDIEDIESNLDILMRSDRASFHTFSMRKEQFDEIREGWREFIELIDGVDYAMRNHEYIRNELGTRHSSNDSLLQKLLLDAGYFRVRPLISRAQYIGMEGFHSSVENFQRQFEGSIGKLEYKKDAEIDEFRLHERSTYQ